MMMMSTQQNVKPHIVHQFLFHPQSEGDQFPPMSSWKDFLKTSQPLPSRSLHTEQVVSGKYGNYIPTLQHFRSPGIRSHTILQRHESATAIVQLSTRL